MHQVDVAIIGAGFSGIGAAIRLDRAGFGDYVVLERADDIGGTWRDNTYPGCACDVQSHLYSFSFAPKPDWSHSFSRQPEIWDYLKGLAADAGVLPRMRLGCEVRDARWDPAHGWALETSRGPLRARVLVMAAGALSEPVLPALPGLDRFAGDAFHSARWDHAAALGGRRVAVIGTGASAIQFVPEIQPRVARLHLFQRTAPWVLPRADRPLRAWEHRLFRRAPGVQRLIRGAIYAARESYVLAFRSPGMVRRAHGIALRHLRRQVADRALRERLTPRFTLGCKRVLLSNDYYPALTRANVEVVTEGIAEVRERSIVTADGRVREVDLIVFATGFRPTDPPLGHHVRGAAGRTLAEVWEGSPRAHAGTTVAGFPNLFILLGPNTALGHSSVLYMIEAQLDHLVSALEHMRGAGVRAVEPRAEAQAAYVAGVDRRAAGTVWLSGGCESWYLDRTGRNSTIWPDFTWRFRRRVARYRPEEYRVVDAG